MRLKDFITPFSQADLEAFASHCGVSVGQMKHIANGQREARESVAICIERETKGAVRCEDLRPDVDWQYLRASEVKPTTKPKRKAA